MSAWDTLKSIATFSKAELTSPVEVLTSTGPADQYAVAANAIPGLAWQFGRPTWPSWDPYAGATAYARLALIYRCVNIVAHALGTAPVAVTADDADDEPIADHPLTQLMKRPNPNMGAASFWSHVAVRTATSGFCVIEKERDRLGNVIALHPLISAYLKAKLRRDGRHDWEYRIPGIVEPFPLSADDVLVFRWADTPSGSPYGMGPLEACLREVTLNNSLIDFTKSYVERGAAPMFAIIPDPAGMQLSQQEADAMIDDFVARRMGLSNAVRPMYMGAIKDLKTVGNNLEEMAYQALRDMNELGIVQAFGIPASVAQIRVGLEHSDSRANAEVDEGKLYRQTIIPLWTRFDDALTLGLLSEYPDSDRVSLTFDTSDIQALQEDRNAKAAWVNASVSGGWLSVHAAHREMGLPLPEGEDYFLRSIAIEAIPVSDPMPKPAPVPKALQPGQAEDDNLFARSMRNVLNEVHAADALALHATTQSTGYAARYARVQSSRKLIQKIADTRLPSISRFFTRQGERFAELLAEWLALSLSPSVIDEHDWQGEEIALRDTLRPLYDLAGTTAYGQVSAEVGVGISWDLANPNLEHVRRSLAQRVTGMTDESRRQIQNIITDGLQRGVSIDELMTDLQAKFTTWSDSRAMTVSRTESAFAYNSASVQGYRDSGVVDRVQMFDNGAHDTDPQLPTLTTCADRDGMIVGLDVVDAYIASAHPNCILATAGVLIGEDA